jgi:nitroreductase
MALEAIQTIRAVREFSDKQVPEETIRQVVNAGRRSQSSKNSQTWTFVVVRDRSTLARLSECGVYAKHLAGAAFAVALISPVDNDFDLGQATAYMQLAAWELGIGSCIATMHDPDCARGVLGVPDDRNFHTAISFGYAAHEQPAKLKRGGRLSFDEVVRWEKWSPPSSSAEPKP